MPVELDDFTGLVLVAKGNDGEVYRGHRGSDDLAVALKIFSGQAAAALRELRFGREARALRLLAGHPCVLSLLGEGTTDDGRPYLVTEWLPAGSLADRVAGRLPVPAALDLGVRVASALHVAHDLGILHRDVKPANVLFAADGTARLADFGLARVRGAARTTTGTVHASLPHTAPEVFLGHVPSPAADVYSLGSTLFEALAGAPPFGAPAGQRTSALLARLRTEPPPDLRPLGVPDQLAGAVEAAMAKQPGERPVPASEFASLLGAAQSALGLPRTPPVLHLPGA